jgi:hypothetical protein
MRHTDVFSQLETAFGNVESALKNLSDRLDDALPDYGRRHPVKRAGQALRRRANEMAERVRSDHDGSLMEDTRRTVREHPVGTMLAAAAAGFVVWSLLRMGNSEHGRSGMSRTLDRFRAAQGDDRFLRH